MKNFLIKKSKNKTLRGFTLIELLVVVAIISLLSSVVLASLKDAREKAKASQLTQNMLQIRNAMELYRSDKGEYPNEDNSVGGGELFDDLINGDKVLSDYLKQELVDNNYLSAWVLDTYIDSSVDYQNVYYSGNMMTNNGGDRQIFCGDEPVNQYVLYTASKNVELGLPKVRYTDGGYSFNMDPLGNESFYYCIGQ